MRDEIETAESPPKNNVHKACWRRRGISHPDRNPVRYATLVVQLPDTSHANPTRLCCNRLDQLHPRKLSTAIDPPDSQKAGGQLCRGRDSKGIQYLRQTPASYRSSQSVL